MSDSNEPEPASGAFQIIIANEPFAYRDVLHAMLRNLRPDVIIHNADPADLRAEVDRYLPHLVICSRESFVPPVADRAWIVLNPDGKGRAMLAMRDVLEEVEDVDFDGLLALIGRAERAMLACAP